MYTILLRLASLILSIIAVVGAAMAAMTVTTVLVLLGSALICLSLSSLHLF